MTRRGLFRTVAVALTGAVFALGSAASTASAASADQTAIETVIKTYERALNAGDIETILGLYAQDGVFMPQHSPSQVGKTAVRAAYARVFKAIDLDVAFRIVEIRQLAPDWAFARTTSRGTVKINANGKTAPEANQELFLFRKNRDGSWRIARYIFSTTNPPR